MKLQFEQIAKAATGTIRSVVTDKGLELHRFTESQMAEFNKPLKYFENIPFFDGYFFRNCRSCSGVTLDFCTDSNTFTLNIAENERTNDSDEGTFDLYVNGELFESYGADKGFSVNLKSGNKRVTVCFPYFNFPIVSSVSIDDGATFTPYGDGVDILLEGDSITQGVSAKHSGLIWPMIVSRKCNARILNQANSGYVYNKKILEKVCEPKIVIASYGTNDCNNKSDDELYDHTKEFILKIKELYPKSFVIGILPPFNYNEDCQKNIKEKSKILKKAYEDVGIMIVDGSKLIPHNEKYFMDDGTHPNDEGFKFYGNRLAKIITETYLL